MTQSSDSRKLKKHVRNIFSLRLGISEKLKMSQKVEQHLNKVIYKHKKKSKSNFAHAFLFLSYQQCQRTFQENKLRKKNVI